MLDADLNEDPFGDSFLLAGLTGADDDHQNYTLPFAFTFYDETYTTISVNSNGAIAFGPDVDTSYPGSESDLLNYGGDYGGSMPMPMLAPFWSDMSLYYSGAVRVVEDDEEHSVTVVWDQTGSYSYEYVPYSFSTTLFDNGSFSFSYADIPDIDFVG